MKPFGRPAADTPLDEAMRKMSAALDIVAGTPDDQAAEALTILVNTLRPARVDDVETAGLRLQALSLLVTQHKDQRARLRELLLRLLSERQTLHLYTDSGILSNEGFWSGWWRRVGQRILPDEANPENLRDNLRVIFRDRRDHEWIEGVPADTWIALLDALEFDHAEGPDAAAIKLLDAIQVISYRITALGLEPELVRNHPAIERYESPFLMQNVEVRQFIDERKQAIADKRAPTLDDKHLQVLLEQCGDIVRKIRRSAEKDGASVSLTYLLVRLEQNLERTALLLRLFEDRPEHDRNIDRLGLFRALVRSVCRRNHLGDLWNRTTELLAQRITGHAGQAGEAYITATRAEYVALRRSAAGAGLLVAFMSFVKLWQSATPHAPLVEAVLYSLNYAIGFFFMSALHFSLATKQPAMTANRIAHSLDAESTRDGDRLDGLADLVVRTIRSQWAAIVGNFIIVIPLAVLLSLAVLLRTGSHYLAEPKALALLGEVDPLSATTWAWASLTGVWLFISGLVSGYYDNKAVYDRIPQRLQQLRRLRRWLGPTRLAAVAAWVERHLGAVAGSVFFGILLGSTGAIGDIVGLPLDTLHVTFSTANVFYALSALDWDIGISTVLRTALGIVIIGLLNLGVSFALAMWVAMRASGVEFAESLPLVRKLGARFAARPRDFFSPPPDPPAPDPAAAPQDQADGPRESER